VRLADTELTPQRLVEVIDSLRPDQLRAMASASSSVGRRDAAERVLSVLHEVVEAR
jgi:UDP-N-acetylglucosamine:LPS N-acetylglucosamine transferase